MGSGATLPGRVGIKESLFGIPKTKVKGIMGNDYEIPGQESSIPGGQDLYDTILKQFKGGLPDNIRDIYLKQGKGQIGSNLAQGQQSLKESLAGAGGNVPIDALIAGQTKLQSNANKEIAGLNDTVAMRDMDFKEQGYNDLLKLFGLASGDSNSTNQYNMAKYQTDKANEFSWGDALGGLFGLGGNVGGEWLKRKSGK